jgi:hypothetical protein
MPQRIQRRDWPEIYSDENSDKDSLVPATLSAPTKKGSAFARKLIMIDSKGWRPPPSAAYPVSALQDLQALDSGFTMQSVWSYTLGQNPCRSELAPSLTLRLHQPRSTKCLEGR